MSQTKVTRVLLILPNRDFDVTETAVPWRTLTNAGVKVDFATEDGKEGVCDPRLLTGVIFGQLGAADEAKQFYKQMTEEENFKTPKSYENTDFMEYDGVILPGGHAKGMIPYLENTTLQSKMVEMMKDPNKTVGAICHGTIVLARAKDPSTGKSLLYDRRSTCLPKYMEMAAFFLTWWKLGRYYRTYSKYVEEEVRECMKNPGKQFDCGYYNPLGSLSPKYASVCVDNNYISARWPGDAYLFANAILDKLKAQK